MEPNSIDQVKADSSPQVSAAIALGFESQNAPSAGNWHRLPTVAHSAEVHGHSPRETVLANPAPRTPNHRIPHPVLWFSETLRSRWDVYRQRLRECRKQASTDSVHELRVATRRLISQLFLLQAMGLCRKREKICGVLKRQLKSLGPLRDTHVQQKIIEQQASQFPELLLLRKNVKRLEATAIKTSARHIQEFGTKKLERWIGGLISELSERETDTRRNERLTAVALSCAGRAFEETVRRRQSIDSSDLRTIHRTRIAFKKFRYIVESLPPSVTGLGRRDLRVLAWYQRRMGNIQDLEVVQASVEEFLRRRSHAEALFEPFSGYLKRRRSRALRSFHRSADKLFDFWPLPGFAAPKNAAKRSADARFAMPGCGPNLLAPEHLK